MDGGVEVEGDPVAGIGVPAGEVSGLWDRVGGDDVSLVCLDRVGLLHPGRLAVGDGEQPVDELDLAGLRGFEFQSEGDLLLGLVLELHDDLDLHRSRGDVRKSRCREQQRGGERTGEFAQQVTFVER